MAPDLPCLDMVAQEELALVRTPVSTRALALTLAWPLACHSLLVIFHTYMQTSCPYVQASFALSQIVVLGHLWAVGLLECILEVWPTASGSQRPSQSLGLGSAIGTESQCGIEAGAQALRPKIPSCNLKHSHSVARVGSSLLEEAARSPSVWKCRSR